MVNKTPKILYEDDDVLVLLKPAGMIVNNADTSRDVYTLQDYVDEKYPIKVSNESEDFLKRSGIVHRLDKETSGAIIIAKNYLSFKNLQKQFKDRTIEKKYTTLVHGKLVEDGIINAPIGRLPWNRMRFGIIPNGRESLTEFRVIRYYKIKSRNNDEILSLAEVYPKTGRTHQIRVHFQYAGFPVFGDELYAGRKMFSRDKKILERHFLHASEIKFIHPKSGRSIEVKAPLTTELEKVLQNLIELKA